MLPRIRNVISALAPILTAALIVALSAPVFANNPPNTPTITEPSVDGQIVNPADVHMETAPFSDPDPGDTHVCSDWEIWTITPLERVWVTSCIGGVERVHTHLGDGTFENSHAGRSDLIADTDYKLRVRHKDSSGDLLTEWSNFAQRPFRTGPPTQIFPLMLDDVAVLPTPQWTDSFSGPIILPGGPVPASLRVDSATDELLLEIRGLNGAGNTLTNPVGLAEHVAVRVHIASGASSLALPESQLAFTDDHGANHSLYLPSMNLAASQTAYFWVSTNGSTYVGAASQTQPDFSTLARGSPVPFDVNQPGFKVEIVATGFQLPVNIAFVQNPGPNPSDPYYYVNELYGQIKVVTRDGTISNYATGLLNFDPTGAFPGSGEQGLTGLAIDAATGDLFVSVLYDGAPPNGPHYPKVIRFHSNDGGHTFATQTVIRDMAGETQGQSHQISNVSIGPDGKLYVHLGDGFDTATAQNLDSYRGKILRMNLNGTAPTDNPFYNAGNGINARDYVFAYGFRNPFGGCWRAADGKHYEVENGPSVDRFAQIVRGRNYLWDGSDVSMANFAIYNWNPAHAPVNIAFVQSATFGGSGFPVSKMDHAFVAESGPTWATGPQSLGKAVTEFVIDAAGNLVSGPTPLVTYTGSGKGSVVALTAGPDGLYFSDFYKDVNYQSPIDPGANILRIRYVGTADFNADITSAAAPPLTVHFTDASVVPNPSAWSWNFGDGGTSTQQNPSHTYTANGSFDVRLSVTGSNGVVVTQRSAFIRIGVPVIAFIGGSIPPGGADGDVVAHLQNLGYAVDAYDDDRSNRPTAAQLAAEHALVIVSSTISSANVAGDFSDAPVPLIFWEQALARTDREPLAGNGITVGGQTAISILDSTHPITAGLALGNVTVFNPAATMSAAQSPFASGAVILAARAAAPGDAAIIAAKAGAILLNGHVAPARRVFLFFEDASWLSATPAAKQIFDQAVRWAINQYVCDPCDANCDGTINQFDISSFVAAFGVSPPDLCSPCAADANADGSINQFDIQPFVDCLGG